MVAGDGGPGGVRTAMGAPAVRDQVRAALTEMLDGPVDAIRLRRTKFKPGRKLTAWFDVASGGARRPVSVAWWADGASLPPGDDALEAEARDRGLAAPFRHLLLDLPGPARVQAAPFDAAFPRLVPLSDPAHASAVSGLGPPVAVRTLRYRPGQRHVLRYGKGPTQVYVKLYAEKDAGARAQTAAAVGALLPETQARVRWLDAERAALVAHAPGRPLAKLLLGAPMGHLTDAGRLLSRIHQSPAAAGLPVHTLAAELAAVARAAEAIDALLPATGASIREVLARTAEVMAALPGEDPVVLHGDYKSDHVLVGSTTTVIDFDRCGTGDAALDLAKFLADLRWWLPDEPARAAAEQAFLAGYGHDGARLARARALEPLFSLKLTARRVRLHDAGWASRAAELVVAAATRMLEVSRA